MNREQKTKEKICAFYASDYHFEMISLPYIEKNINADKEVIILTENNLEDTINELISKVNLKEENKQKILNINWKDNDLEKFKLIKNEADKEKIVFVKGNKNYIKNINENIENLMSNKENLTIIDCYNIDEIHEDMNTITEKYRSILSTTGTKEIQKL